MSKILSKRILQQNPLTLLRCLLLQIKTAANPGTAGSGNRSVLQTNPSFALAEVKVPVRLRFKS